MKKIILLPLILFLSCPFSAPGAPSLMVERHIFSPEQDGKGTHKTPMTLKLEKELMFTGVIISSRGKWAIIRETGKKKDEKDSGLRKEGDEIRGMLIKEIGSNFLILAREGKEVRLNLYHGGKPRPPMPAGSESSSVSAEINPSRTPAVSSEPGATTTGTTSTLPVSQFSKPPVKKPEKKSSAFPPVANPFPQITPPNPFQQEAQNPFMGQNPNPFLREPPPNPFQQAPPPNPYVKQSPNAEGK